MKSLGNAGALALLALLCAAAAFWPVAVQLFELWMDTDRPYSHGLLVGPISVWLVACACRDEWHARSSRSWSALVLFVGASLVWIGAYAVDIVIGQQLLWPALLVLAVATAAGWPMARKLAFPIGFLYFAIPIWSAATGTLQSITVAVVGAVLNVARIPLYVEGNFITIPEGVFEVAGGCAGLHFFIVAVTVASFHGYSNLASLWRRLALVGAAALVALVTNWLRVGSLVAIGHYSDMQHYLIRNEHYYYGWVLFAIALIPLFFIARRLADGDRVVDVPVQVAARQAADGSWRLRDTAVVAALGVSLSLPFVLIFAGSAAAPAASVELELPEGKGGWRLTAPPPRQAWEPSFDGADGAVLASYVRDDARVDVYLAVYRSQAQGRELIADHNRLFAADHRRLSARSVAVAGVPRLEVVREQVASSPGGAGRVVWYWYAIGPRLVIDDLQAKLWQAFGRFRGGDSGAVTAVSVACGRDCGEAGGGLELCLESMGEALVAASLANQAGSVR
jgi:exosortase A